MQMMEKIIYWVRDDWSEVRLGQPALEGQVPSCSLAVPMMMLCLIDQMETMDPSLSTKYQDIAKWSLDQALMHIQVVVTVGVDNHPTGKILPFYQTEDFINSRKKLRIL